MRICLLNLILKSSDHTDYDSGILVCKLISFISVSVLIIVIGKLAGILLQISRENVSSVRSCLHF